MLRTASQPALLRTREKNHGSVSAGEQDSERHSPRGCGRRPTFGIGRGGVPRRLPVLTVRGTRFEGLLPADTVVVEAQPAMWEQGLWENELAQVLRCGLKRRREFTAGRNCVRHALRTMGRHEVAILVGKGREPLLPEGLVGSITHTDTYCAAALRCASGGLSIGIDAEVAGRLEEGVAGLIMGAAERAQVGHLESGNKHRAWGHVVFSAKEAFHKALYRRWPVMLDFLDAEVRIAPDHGEFTIRLADPRLQAGAGGEVFKGHFRFADELVLTTICVPL